MTTYKINYNTGAGDMIIDVEDLQDAMDIADDNAVYTQQPIKITDDDNHILAQRNWYGCASGSEEEENPIIFGSFGFYGDWYIND